MLLYNMLILQIAIPQGQSSYMLHYFSFRVELKTRVQNLLVENFLFLKGNSCKNMEHKSLLYTAFDNVFLLMQTGCLMYGKR